MNPKLHHRTGDYANDAFAGKVINVWFYSLLKTPFTYCPFYEAKLHSAFIYG